MTKKHTFFLFALCGATLSNAQITLTSATMPKAGAVIENASIETAAAETLSIGNGGASQTWDFSAVPVEPFSNYPTFFSNPAQTPYAGSFPLASLASSSELSDTTEYAYYKLTNAEYSLLGIADPEQNIAYSQPFKFLQFPFTYQNTFSQSVNISGNGGGFPANGAASTTVLADGYGSVKTQLGTFPCLRVKRISEINLTVLIFNIIQRDTVFEWWTNQYNSPVFTYTHSYLNFAGDETLDVYAETLTQQTVDSKEPVAQALNLLLTPNPSEGPATLRFELKNAGKADVAVFDLQGKKLLSQHLGNCNPGVNTADIDLSPLPSGNYFLALTGSGKVMGMRQIVKR